MMDYQELDPLNCPLSGVTLIEAGAGTGKTYTITSIFLRLILERGLDIGKILVVTFTKAATEEIRDRTRKKLYEGIKAFSTGQHGDPFLRELLKKGEDPAEAVKRLRKALRGFDQASIFTIHGFCRRMLQENAFETGCLFDTELTAQEERLTEEAVHDFWRKKFYQADPEFVGYALRKGISPIFFSKQARGSMPHRRLRILPDMESFRPEGLDALRSSFEGLKEAWSRSKEEVRACLMDPGLNGRSYGTLDPVQGSCSKRERLLSEWLFEMDRFLSSPLPSVSLFSGFEKLTAETVRASTKKGFASPEHPTFDLCQAFQERAEALAKEMDRVILALQLEFHRFLKQALAETKKKRNLRAFDDLLVELQEALEARNGTTLLQTVQSKYGAALIDEFQDTDPVQYRTFRTLFGTPERPLFLIGDPKQAIYSFRGADLFTYMNAAREVDHRFTLCKNFRSEPPLLKAVNAVFSFKGTPFLYEAIQCPRALPGTLETEGLRAEGEADSPFTIWLLEEGDDPSKPWPKEPARRRIARGVAEEMVKLLRLGKEGKACVGGEGLKEKHLAVLVRKNREAQIVQEALAAKRIRSVLYSTGNLFETREAEEMERLLRAIAIPEREANLRGALATSVMGFGGEELDRLSVEESSWEEILYRFMDYHESWEKQGFIPMIRSLFAKEEVAPRLLAHPDGERRLTNFLHLSEVLHRESLDGHLGISGLIKWLSAQRDPDAPRLEEHQLRLESDEEAVKIVTIHKSKGLEYPVVFCPFLWEGSEVPEGGITFHDRLHGDCLTLDLGSPEKDDHKALAEEELLSENLRLTYVALTRARNRCYMAWGRIKGAETSAPAYLLHGRGSLPPERALKETSARFLGLRREEILEDLEVLVARSEGTLSISGLPEGSEEAPSELFLPREPLVCRPFTGAILRDWRLSSFTSLVSGRPQPEEGRDYDSDSKTAREGDHSRFGGLTGDVFSLPGGSRTGIFLHDVFEQLDFRRGEDSIRKELVRERLKAHGFEESWSDTVLKMIRSVLTAPLSPEDRDLVLGRIGMEDRLNELEFYFPLKRISHAELGRIFKEHGRRLGDLPERIEKLQFAPTRGFMRGFIDLVFRWKDRYFLVDWKSNLLGRGPVDYAPGALEKVMAEEYYMLQYHLYAVALDQYLRLRLPGYRYEKHFGGCYYVFLRGVDASGGDCGIYRDTPPPALMGALREALIPG